MKKIMIMASLLIGMIAFAQPQKGKQDRTSEQVVENQVKKMTLDLDLNEKQQAELKALLTEQQAKREAVREEIKAKRAENQKLAKEEKEAIKGKFLDEKLAMKDKMKQILTPEQFEKWEANQQEREQKQKERMEKRNEESRGQSKKIEKE
jgi:hypothetical protein